MSLSIFSRLLTHKRVMIGSTHRSREILQKNVKKTALYRIGIVIGRFQNCQYRIGSEKWYCCIPNIDLFYVKRSREIKFLSSNDPLKSFVECESKKKSVYILVFSMHLR